MIQDETQYHNKTEDLKLAYDVARTAALLGVSPFSVRELIRTGRLGHVRIGRLIRVPQDAIDRFLAGSAI